LKVECFCFEERRLLAGEEVLMLILFFIEADMQSCVGKR
jgi:cytochrome c oxidase assembly protein Cox11